MLSGFFFMLTLLAYAAYAKSVQFFSLQCSEKETQTWKLQRSSYYALTLTCFAVGLLCKPMLITLPLLLDYWPLGRIRILTTDNT